MYCASLYIPHFPAWAFLQQEEVRPPLLVVANGRVVAADAGLRRIGVAAGITAERVQALVPEVSICLRDPSFERAAWEEVLQTINRFTPFLENAQISGASMTGGASTPGSGSRSGGASTPGSGSLSGNGRFAYFLPPDHHEDTRALAEVLQAQVGIGPRRNVALLASLKPAAGTVLSIEERHVSSFLNQYPVEKLAELAFEDRFLEQILLFGYKTLGQVKMLSLRHLKAQFAEEGERLHALLHPEEPEKNIPPFRPLPSLTAHYEFEHPVSEPADLLPALEYLIERLAARLGERRSQRIKVSLQCLSGESRFVCRVLPEPLDSPRRLMHTARTLLMGMLTRSMQVETLTLELSALRRPDAAQGSLFTRRPALQKAVDAVGRRFPGALKRAEVQPDAVFPEEAVSFGER